MYTQQELIGIASFGGGLTLDANKHTVDELKQIASYASSKGSRITITLKNKKLLAKDINSISSFGKGCVSFEEIY